MNNYKLSKVEVLALSKVKGIGNQALLLLVKKNWSFFDIQDLPVTELAKYIKGRNSKDAISTLKEGIDGLINEAHDEISLMREKDIEIVSFVDHKYPQYYRFLKDAPIVLYCRGNISLLNNKRNIAVVGTRDCSEIGYQIAFKTAKYFASMGYNIVSGLAKGIDSAGHKGALESKGRTTAILVDVAKIYPAANKGLANEILDSEGLLISENRPGAFTGRGAFVSRDRLQSGLSLGVFAIETDIKGGTMHTVGFTQDQNRLLLCPDLINTPKYDLSFEKSRGVQMLINNRRAIAYTSKDYSNIEMRLNKKLIDLENIEKGISNNGNWTMPF